RWFALAAGDRKRLRPAEKIGFVGFLSQVCVALHLFRSRWTADGQLPDAHDARADARAGLALWIQGDLRDANAFLVVHRLQYGPIGIDDGGKTREEPFDLVRWRLVRAPDLVHHGHRHAEFLGVPKGEVGPRWLRQAAAFRHVRRRVRHQDQISRLLSHLGRKEAIIAFSANANANLADFRIDYMRAGRTTEEIRFRFSRNLLPHAASFPALRGGKDKSIV